jgi:hypothetical protein
MAKRKNNPTPAEDYLNQVHWEQQKRSSRWTAKVPDEPKWKFRILHQRDQIPVPLRLLFILIVLGIAGFGIFTLYQKYLSIGSSYTLATLVVFIFIVLIVLFATFDKKRKS